MVHEQKPVVKLKIVELKSIHLQAYRHKYTKTDDKDGTYMQNYKKSI